MFSYFDLRMYCLWGLSCIGAVSILEKVMPDFGFVIEVIIGSLVGWAIITSYTAALQDLSLGAIDKTLAFLDAKGYIDRDSVVREITASAGEDDDE